MASGSPIGQTGRVTGRIAPGTVGEIILTFQGGSNTYHAKPADGESTYNVDELVSVVDFSPPLTVYVV